MRSGVVQVTPTISPAGSRAFTLPDTTTILYAPVMVQGLVDAAGGGGTFEDPAPLAEPSDGVGTITDQLDRVTSYETDRWGQPTKITDDLGNVTTITRNIAGLPVQMVKPDPDGAGSLGTQVWDYTYDSKFNLTDLDLPDDNDLTWTYHA